MKTSKYLLTITFLTSFLFNCSSNKKFNKNIQKGRKYDTIYYYFKNVKNEGKKVYIQDTLNNRLQTQYKMKFKKSGKYFFVISNTHYKARDTLNKNNILLYKTKVIEKDRNFLKQYKSKIFIYDDFKNKTEIELNRFFYGNKFNAFYLIDKSENKNGKIFLKAAVLSGNFDRIQ